MIDYSCNMPTTHYEWYIDVSKLTNIDEIKEQAFDSMCLLEGWCTPTKASFLMDLVFILRPKKVVEIGVFGGKSVVPMAFALKKNKTGKVYGIDPWKTEESTVGMEGVDKDYWGQLDHQKILRDLKEKIIQLDLSEQIQLIETTSEGAEPIHQIDILHIDGNHSEQTSYFDVTKWAPMVKTGGVIVFDDLDWPTTAKAVAWLDEHCIRFTEVHDRNLWAIWIKP